MAGKARDGFDRRALFQWAAVLAVGHSAWELPKTLLQPQWLGTAPHGRLRFRCGRY